MTKFEEELFYKVPCKFELTTEAEYKKTTLINHFKNWHSDEEFKAEIKKLRDQLITRNDELISSNYEIESLKSQLISREKQVIELKEADKAQGKEIIQLKSQLQQQPLPVVTSFVAEWIEILKTKGLKPLKNPETYGETGFTEKKIQNIVFWISEHQEDYMRAWLDDYTVEKPQQKRYEVKLLSGEPMHFNPIGNPKNIKDYRFGFGNYTGWKTQFTKSELVEIKDGMFLKRIPGGTPLDDLGKDKSYFVWIEDCNYWKNPFIELVAVEDGE